MLFLIYKDTAGKHRTDDESIELSISGRTLLVELLTQKVKLVVLDSGGPRAVFTFATFHDSDTKENIGDFSREISSGIKNCRLRS